MCRRKLRYIGTKEMSIYQKWWEDGWAWVYENRPRKGQTIAFDFFWYSFWISCFASCIDFKLISSLCWVVELSLNVNQEIKVIISTSEWLSSHTSCQWLRECSTSNRYNACSDLFRFTEAMHKELYISDLFLKRRWLPKHFSICIKFLNKQVQEADRFSFPSRAFPFNAQFPWIN